ncbi:hypothetical protein NMY22_g9739 [Coprinellus aureogranulatus]|nr:hypothetical protein NMY22_g9739 [Coprinellus aureogranulatus]
MGALVIGSRETGEVKDSRDGEGVQRCEYDDADADKTTEALSNKPSSSFSEAIVDIDIVKVDVEVEVKVEVVYVYGGPRVRLSSSPSFPSTSPPPLSPLTHIADPDAHPVTELTLNRSTPLTPLPASLNIFNPLACPSILFTTSNGIESNVVEGVARSSIWIRRMLPRSTSSAPSASSPNKPTPTTASPTQVAGARCPTLDDEGITRCDRPATHGKPKEWCREHHGQYRKLYTKYKDAGKRVDQVREGNDMPSEEQISQYSDRKVVLGKLKWVAEYIRAIREERTGREIHNRHVVRSHGKPRHPWLSVASHNVSNKRFFLKVDSGHKTRINMLAKELERANRVMEKLGSRFLDLYNEEHPGEDWTRGPADQEILKGALFESTQKKASNATPDIQSREPQAAEGVPSDPQLGGDDDDLITLQHQAEKRRLVTAYEPFMDEELGRKFSHEMFISRGGDPNELPSALSRYVGMLHYLSLSQYARRVVFYDPILFAKSLDKVSFRDLVLSDDFDMEDTVRFMGLFGQCDGYPLPWLKDSIFEALKMIKRMKNGPPEHASANFGKVDHRFRVLGGWIYNQRHKDPVSDEVWWHLFKFIDPQANTENRYVRLCNSYEDLIGMLSVGALGLLPSPGFCKFPEEPRLEAGALASRKHLSLSGIVVADLTPGTTMSSLFNSPIPTPLPATRPGNIVWAETDTRSYMFGAVRHEKDAFTEAFLDELRSRPDLFQLLVWSETEPESSLEESGSDHGKALPPMRFRKFEAPRSRAPPSSGHGEWEVMRTPRDILFSQKKEKIVGYITNIRNQVPGWFFRFKTFPVRYFVVLDTVPKRHPSIVLRNVAWAALRAGKYGSGEYTDSKYHKASDKLFEEKSAQRLSWMNTDLWGGWTTTKMAMSDDEDDSDEGTEKNVQDQERQRTPGEDLHAASQTKPSTTQDGGSSSSSKEVDEGNISTREEGGTQSQEGADGEQAFGTRKYDSEAELRGTLNTDQDELTCVIV